MICANCTTQNLAGTKFCKECGIRLGLTCGACGTALAADAKFCGECGTSVTPGSDAARVAVLAGPRQESAPLAERRLVSVLFADLVGFTPYAEERDAEDVRDTLTRYFDLARDVIERYGGTVEKFIGDAVMAVWGAPTAHEDDAERAVRAALELVDVVRPLGAGIQARAGVLTGEAAVTLGATNQGMVAGDIVNTASRLQGAAPPGAVLVGEATRRSASGAIAFEPAGERTLKGKSVPVAAWRALRVVANRGGQGRSDLPEPPFVGRDEELRVLKDALTAQARDPRVRVVSITGPAGIGKSRLAWEFEKYVDGLVETVYWHRGRSPSYGEGISFWALGEMVRERAGLAEADDEATTRAAIAAAVVDHVPSDDDRRWVVPALLALLGIGETPIGGRDVLFAAWRIFFERIAAHATTVLLFEDLHWADLGLLDFIDHLVEWARGVPLLIVTLARPELFERRPTWGAGQRHFTSIALEPLPPRAMRELLAGFVPGLPDHAAEAILARADGIPLYAVETVRALVGSGRLTEVDGAYRPVGDLDTLAIPETLQSLIASRLDSLSREDRTLIQDAAVLGQTFTPAALAAVSDVAAADLEPRLRALVRRELFELRADPRSPERGQYAFVQSLIREVAYGTLARRERRARHLAVARYFEGLGEEELAGAQANHYLAAYQASTAGPEADAVGIQARLALRAAAARAAGLGAHEQAVGLLREALGIASDAGEQAELMESAAISAGLAGQLDEGVELFDQSIAAWRAIGDRSRTARVIAEKGDALLNGYRVDAGLDLLEAAASEFDDVHDTDVRPAIARRLARALMLSEDHPRALEVVEVALTSAEHNDLIAPLADALITKGTALISLGRIREGNGVVGIGEGLARDHDLPRTLLRALNNRSIALEMLDAAAALAVVREGLELSRRIGDRRIEGNFVLAVGWQLYQRGDWDASLAVLDEGMAELPEGMILGALRRQMVVLRASRGQPVDAVLRELESAASHSFMQEADAASAAAVVAFMAGDFEGARARLHHVAKLEAANRIFALAAAARAGAWAFRPDWVRADLAALDMTGVHGPTVDAIRATMIASLAALEGRQAEAVIAFQEARLGWRTTAFRWQEALTGLDAAILIGPVNAHVREFVEDATALFVSLGAAPYLKRMEDALRIRPREFRDEWVDRGPRAASESSRR